MRNSYGEEEKEKLSSAIRVIIKNSISRAITFIIELFKGYQSYNCGFLVKTQISKKYF